MKPLVFTLAFLVVTGCVTRDGTQAKARPLTRLNSAILVEALKEILPPERFDASQSYDSLLANLQHFGIRTVGEVRDMVVKNIAVVEAEERKQYEFFRQFGEQYHTRPPTVARGYHYNHAGMARIALRAYVGEEVFFAYELDKFRKGELPKKPNKAPEPTTRSVTPRAFLRNFESPSRTDLPITARVAPERVVAHL